MTENKATCEPAACFIARAGCPVVCDQGNTLAVKNPATMTRVGTWRIAIGTAYCETCDNVYAYAVDGEDS